MVEKGKSITEGAVKAPSVLAAFLPNEEDYGNVVSNICSNLIGFNPGQLDRTKKGGK